jgi:hypothetical protein
MLIHLALVLIRLTGPDGSEIDFNPGEIISLRAREERDTYHSDVKCVIRTVDGNTIGVEETCAEVRDRIDRGGAQVHSPVP